jgi:hypothetical protein
MAQVSSREASNVRKVISIIPWSTRRVSMGTDGSAILVEGSDIDKLPKEEMSKLGSPNFL